MEIDKQPAWSDLIRAEREEAGHSVITWKVVAEGAIVSVSEGPSCAGVWVYLFGGPEKPKSPSMWNSDLKSTVFPQLKAYHSCPSKDEYEGVINEPSSWIEEGENFLRDLRNNPQT